MTSESIAESRENYANKLYNLYDDIRNLIRRVNNLKEVDGYETLIARCQSEKERLELLLSGNNLRICFLGEFSSGKSYIINLLVGKRILPTSVVPTTQVPTVVSKIIDNGQERYIMNYLGSMDEFYQRVRNYHLGDNTFMKEMCQSYENSGVGIGSLCDKDWVGGFCDYTKKKSIDEKSIDEKSIDFVDRVKYNEKKLEEVLLNGQSGRQFSNFIDLSDNDAIERMNNHIKNEALCLKEACIFISPPQNSILTSNVELKDYPGTGANHMDDHITQEEFRKAHLFVYIQNLDAVNTKNIESVLNKLVETFKNVSDDNKENLFIPVANKYRDSQKKEKNTFIESTPSDLKMSSNDILEIPEFVEKEEEQVPIGNWEQFVEDEKVKALNDGILCRAKPENFLRISADNAKNAILKELSDMWDKVKDEYQKTENITYMADTKSIDATMRSFGKDYTRNKFRDKYEKVIQKFKAPSNNNDSNIDAATLEEVDGLCINEVNLEEIKGFIKEKKPFKIINVTDAKIDEHGRISQARLAKDVFYADPMEVVEESAKKIKENTDNAKKEIFRNLFSEIDKIIEEEFRGNEEAIKRCKGIFEGRKESVANLSSIGTKLLQEVSSEFPTNDQTENNEDQKPEESPEKTENEKN